MLVEPETLEGDSLCGHMLGSAEEWCLSNPSKPEELWADPDLGIRPIFLRDSRAALELRNPGPSWAWLMRTCQAQGSSQLGALRQWIYAVTIVLVPVKGAEKERRLQSHG